jgi:hypothetical protein
MDDQLIELLKERFTNNMHRHLDIQWSAVQNRLETNQEKLKILIRMEETGGEPDVIGYDDNTGEFLYCDCAKESPKGRRSLCYDREAWEARKKFKPESNVIDRAAELGVELLDEGQYRILQELEAVDNKTSSWIKTPESVRALGGALFCDRRFGMVFTYHNGAESYYASRGFRGILRV